MSTLTNAVGIDLKIKRNANKIYDLLLGSNGDFQTVSSFDTSIEMSLFNDQRALPSEVPAANLRRGWWGNETSDTPDFEIGSKLWLLRQARLTQQILNLAVSYATLALDWMISDGYATKIVVNGSLLDQNSMGLNIEFVRPNNVTISKYYGFWNSTGDIS